MEIRVLKYFLAVAREESITKAADVLHITQPTLSRQLMQLEEEFGIRLFKRGKAKISLTDEGMLLRQRAQEIVDLTDKAKRELAEHNRFMEGEISIGSGETYSMNVLSNIMKRFHSEYPLVTYNLYSANADDIKERIDKGLTDIGLLTEPVDITKYDFIRILHKENWGILTHKDSPLAGKENIKPTDLLGEKIIMVRRQAVQGEIANWFGEYFEQLDIIATYNLIYNASIMVENGLGVAICFDKLVRESKEADICFRPLCPVLSTGAVIVWKKNQIHSSVVEKFIQEMKYALKA